MDFWQQVLSKLQDQHKVYFMTVIENNGSSPGRKGFKMLVAEDGYILGSIGGGVMEYKLVEETKKLLQKANPEIFLKKQIHRRNKENGSGMICSGEQTIVFHPLNAEHIPIVENILDCLKSNSKGTLILTPFAFNFTKKLLEHKFECEITSDFAWSYKEHIGFRNTLYIVGGGHVGVAVSNMFVTLGFHVIVFDDRENLNTLERNTSAHQKKVIDFNDIEKYLLEGSETYVAIMTNRYIDDKLVLSKIIKNSYAYIGVLGSKAKLKTMWNSLKKEGFSKDELENIHAPIGLPIKSQTPIEIAVSIAAEVIQAKNSKKKA